MDDPGMFADEKPSDWRELAVAAPGVLAFAVLMVHTLANAVLRAFGAPLGGTLELGAYWYMPTIALLGTVIAFGRNEHIHADIVTSRAPLVVQRDYRVLGLVIVIVMTGAYAWFGLLEAMKSASITRTASGSDVPIWIPEFLVPLAFGLVVLQAAVVLIRILRGHGEAARPVGSTAERSEA